MPRQAWFLASSAWSLRGRNVSSSSLVTFAQLHIPWLTLDRPFDKQMQQMRLSRFSLHGGWHNMLEATALRLEAIPLTLEAIALRLEPIVFRLGAIALRLEATALRLEAIPLTLEAIALGLEPIVFRLEAIALRLEATALRLEAIPLTLEAIALRLEPIVFRLEAIATYWLGVTFPAERLVLSDCSEGDCEWDSQMSWHV